MPIEMDKRQLPLNALRTFEVTGRLLNMRLAAQELGVTHGAVSQQIRALEARLGTDLFSRGHNRLSFTPQGYRYFKELHRIFDEMVTATRSLDLDSLAGRLRVGCSADTAANWLIPSLAGFLEAYPEIELQVVELKPGEEITTDIEVGVLNGYPITEAYCVEPLRQLQFYPVCAPGLIAGAGMALKPRDLLHYRLLHSDDGQCWTEWRRTAGIGDQMAADQLFLPNVATALGAARQGLGIALAQDLEVADDLVNGALIQLSDLALSSTGQYNLITLRASLMSDRARVFAEWVRQLLAS